MVRQRKYWVGLSIFCVLLSLWPVSVTKAQAPIALYVNGVHLDSDVSPVLDGSRALAPIRVISEFLGVPVQWIGATRTVVIQGREPITLNIDNKQALLGDKIMTLDVAPQIIGGRTMVPLRFVGEALGCDVEWIASTRTIRVDQRGDRITDMALTNIGERDAIRISGDGDLEYTAFLLAEPLRYVLDFKNTFFDSSTRSLEVNSLGITTLRGAQHSANPPVTRLVFDLQENYIPQVERLSSGDLVVWLAGRLHDAKELPLSQGHGLFFRADNLLSYDVAEIKHSQTQEVLYGVVYASRPESKVNIRTGPGTEHSILATIEQGTRLKLIGQTTDWYHVEYGDREGWIADRFLAVTLEMHRTNVNVRQGPSMNDAVIDRVMQGDLIKVLERGLGWYKVETPKGIEGFIADWLIALNERLIQEPEAPDGVSQELSITLHEVWSMPNVVKPNSGLIETVSWHPEGKDTIINVKLSQSVGYELIATDDGLVLQLGSQLQKIVVDNQKGRSEVTIDFDKPTRYMIHQFVEDKAIILEVPYGWVDLDKLSIVGDNGFVNVSVKNTTDGLEIRFDVDAFGGYKVGDIDHSKQIDLTLFEPSLSGKFIAIDAGHGGGDSGARGPRGTLEKDTNLSISLIIAQMLRTKGAIVIMTREADVTISSLQRAQIVNHSGADVAVSIHSNGFSNPQSRGIETLYYPGAESQRLATVLQQSMVQALGLVNRGIVPRPDLYLTREVTMPAVFVEVGFITNLEEEQLLRTADFQFKAAQSIVAGIERYFTGE